MLLASRLVKLAVITSMVLLTVWWNVLKLSKYISRWPLPTAHRCVSTRSRTKRRCLGKWPRRLWKSTRDLEQSQIEREQKINQFRCLDNSCLTTNTSWYCCSDIKKTAANACELRLQSTWADWYKSVKFKLRICFKRVNDTRALCLVIYTSLTTVNSILTILSRFHKG